MSKLIISEKEFESQKKFYNKYHKWRAVSYSEYIDKIGNAFSSVILTFTENATIVTLIIRDIIFNNSYNTNLIKAIYTLKEMMYAQNLLEMLPLPLSKEFRANQIHDKCLDLKKAFLKYYTARIPILFHYKFHSKLVPKNYYPNKNELQLLHSYCLASFYKKYPEAEIKEYESQLYYEFHETLKLMESAYGLWGNNKKRDEIEQIKYESAWLWTELAKYFKDMGFKDDDDWIEMNQIEIKEGGNNNILFKLALNNYFSIYWDSLSDYKHDFLRFNHPIFFMKP